jgi:hypothetical protein
MYIIAIYIENNLSFLLQKLSRESLYKDELQHEIRAKLSRLLYGLFVVKLFLFGEVKNRSKNETLANHCLKQPGMLY